MRTDYSVIDYISGLTSYVFDISVLKRIIVDRGYELDDSGYDISDSDKELFLADLLYVVYIGANSTANYSVKDGAFQTSIGSQTINSKQELYNIIKGIYSKYGDTKLESVSKSLGTLEWINEFD